MSDNEFIRLLKKYDYQNHDAKLESLIISKIEWLSESELKTYFKSIILLINYNIFKAFLDRAARFGMINSNNPSKNIINRYTLIHFFDEDAILSGSNVSLDILRSIIDNGAKKYINSEVIINNNVVKPVFLLAKSYAPENMRLRALNILLENGLEVDNNRHRFFENRTLINYLIRKNKLTEAFVLYKNGYRPSDKYFCNFNKYLSTTDLYGNFIRWCNSSNTHRLKQFKCEDGTTTQICEKIPSLKTLTIGTVDKDFWTSYKSEEIPEDPRKWLRWNPSSRLTEYQQFMIDRKRR